MNSSPLPLQTNSMLTRAYCHLLTFLRMSESNEVMLYLDLHGHSRKQNVFIYGCDQLNDPLTRLRSRVFPKMLSKNATNLFSYKDSKFGVHKSKVSPCLIFFASRRQATPGFFFCFLEGQATSLIAFSISTFEFTCTLYLLSAMVIWYIHTK